MVSIYGVILKKKKPMVEPSIQKGIIYWFRSEPPLFSKELHCSQWCVVQQSTVDLPGRLGPYPSYNNLSQEACGQQYVCMTVTSMKKVIRHKYTNKNYNINIQFFLLTEWGRSRNVLGIASKGKAVSSKSSKVHRLPAWVVAPLPSAVAGDSTYHCMGPGTRLRENLIQNLLDKCKGFQYYVWLPWCVSVKYLYKCMRCHIIYVVSLFPNVCCIFFYFYCNIPLLNRCLNCKNIYNFFLYKIMSYVQYRCTFFICWYWGTFILVLKLFEIRLFFYKSCQFCTIPGSII